MQELGDPAAAADPPGPVGPRPRTRRRNIVVNVLLIGFSLLMGLELYLTYVYNPGVMPQQLTASYMRFDAALGLLACAALVWRRRHPEAVLLVVGLCGAVAVTALGALGVALVGTAIYRPWRRWLPLFAVIVLAAIPWFAIVHDTPQDAFVTGVMAALFMSTCVGWGTAIRSRRLLVARLRADVRRVEEDRERRLADARGEERRRIAREMHDMLAHRMSMLSVHAGALVYRTQRAESGQARPLGAAELSTTLSLIRDNAHQALEELSTILHVLRAGDAEPGDAGTAAPQPGLGDIARLVEESVAAGQRVAYSRDTPDGLAPPEPVGRTAYRIVQEGLTNVRKHAPAAKVAVAVAGAPDRGLRVSVSNALPVGITAAEIPGAGAGLAGLAERVGLLGGRLDSGPQGGQFRLVAWLPWPDDPPEGDTEA